MFSKQRCKVRRCSLRRNNAGTRIGNTDCAVVVDYGDLDGVSHRCKGGVFQTVVQNAVTLVGLLHKEVPRAVFTHSHHIAVEFCVLDAPILQFCCYKAVWFKATDKKAQKLYDKYGDIWLDSRKS